MFPDVAPAHVQLTQTPPSYSLDIYDNFTTMFAEELDVDCTRTYTNDWEVKAIVMISTLNNKLNSGELCPNELGLVTVYTTTTSLTSQGTQVKAIMTKIKTKDNG